MCHTVVMRNGNGSGSGNGNDSCNANGAANATWLRRLMASMTPHERAQFARELVSLINGYPEDRIFHAQLLAIKYEQDCAREKRSERLRMIEDIEHEDDNEEIL